MTGYTKASSAPIRTALLQAAGVATIYVAVLAGILLQVGRAAGYAG